MTNSVDADGGWLYAVVDVSDNSSTVYDGKCRVRMAWVNTVLSNHALPIQDGSTVIRNFAAQAAVNTELQFGDCIVDSLVVDPNDSATGSIVLVYKPE